MCCHGLDVEVEVEGKRDRDDDGDDDLQMRDWGRRVVSWWPPWPISNARALSGLPRGAPSRSLARAASLSRQQLESPVIQSHAKRLE